MLPCQTDGLERFFPCPSGGRFSGGFFFLPFFAFVAWTFCKNILSQTLSSTFLEENDLRIVGAGSRELRKPPRMNPMRGIAPGEVTRPTPCRSGPLTRRPGSGAQIADPDSWKHSRPRQTLPVLRQCRRFESGINQAPTQPTAIVVRRPYRPDWL